MPRKVSVQVSLEKMEEAASKFFPALGRAITEWANVERGLYYWFRGITGMPEGMARAVFYSARSFSGRAEMLIAAIENWSWPETDKRRIFVIAALKKARGYSSFRNRIAHGEVNMSVSLEQGVYTEDDPGVVNETTDNFIEYTIAQGKKISSETISVEDLDNATDNFGLLKQALMDMTPQHRPSEAKSNDDYIALIEALPNQAETKSELVAKGFEGLTPEAAANKQRMHRAAGPVTAPGAVSKIIVRGPRIKGGD